MWHLACIVEVVGELFKVFGFSARELRETELKEIFWNCCDVLVDTLGSMDLRSRVHRTEYEALRLPMIKV